MFPIRDHNPSGRVPYVNYTLIAINVLVFIYYWVLMPQTGSDPFGNTAMVPAEVTNGVDLHGLITSMFQHAGVMHILGNMLFLWIFGDNMEDVFGHVRYLMFYLVTGLAAAAAHIVADPGSSIPVVGASGAVAGVMGGYLLLFPKAKVDVMLILVVIFKRLTIPAFIVLIIWFGLQIFGGAASPSSEGGVAYWAHAGGFIAGVVLSVPVWLRLGGVAFWRRNHGHPPHPEAPLPARFASRPVR
ncbi:MAG: rhomboid family intramembrane serine protease [Burkholderiaceae bacterium]